MWRTRKPPRSGSTSMTSKRQGRSPQPERARNHAAVRTRRVRFTRVTASEGRARLPRERVFTSTKTTVAPSRATRSISPKRERNPRATIEKPPRTRKRRAASSPASPSVRLRGSARAAAWRAGGAAPRRFPHPRTPQPSGPSRPGSGPSRTASAHAEARSGRGRPP